MRKTLTAVVAAATIAVATIAAPTTADARRGWWAPAIIGGLAAGAIIGSAYARPYYGGYYGGYGYHGGYRPAYSYDGYAPAYATVAATRPPTLRRLSTGLLRLLRTAILSLAQLVAHRYRVC